MRAADVFEQWAPAESVWSPWAKPVLFTAIDEVVHDAPSFAPPEPPPLPDASKRHALVVDLPGQDAVELGAALALRGYRPVPLFNGCHGPSPAVDVVAVVQRLVAALPFVTGRPLAADAPPAFLLDVRRHAPAPGPGRFDNRWVVLPQDFPSALHLTQHRIRGAVLVQSGRVQPHHDLAHVLLRWQESGLPILACDVAQPQPEPHPIEVERPSRFRHAVHALLVASGLRRSSAGGFGGLIPLPPPPSTGGGYGGPHRFGGFG